MVVRTWKGATRAGDAEAYLDYLRATGVRAARATPGNRGVWVLRRAVGEGAAARSELLFVSVWEDEGAVRAFAGDDPTRAVFYPEDDRFLVERDEAVAHYELALAEPDVAR